MVKVTYECEETGQKMIVTLDNGEETGTMQMDIIFEPEISDDTLDPFGVMGKLYDAFTPA